MVALRTVEEKLGGAPHSKQTLRLWLRLLTCGNMIEQVVRTRLRTEFATTLPRFDFMAALDRVPEGLPMGRLSRLLMVSNGNVTSVADRLEREGLVKRVRAPEDRRTQIVALTEKGRAEFNKMARVHEGWVEELLSDLSDDDLRRLMALLARTKRSVERHKGEDKA